ncbi:PREDICTED: uncharacterized protein LOC109333948 [Lupinus angustifolius]|uniref:uncharacterized protein LOC109333948 n=1 Tax=Lupinus angustifolius TaxID=3871 RepID=UPI00092E2C88|nr:PREDICTED: uncharacterized protein LOC109333948 [Lupinus angustifolius]
MSSPLPKHLTCPNNIDQYDGTTNPQDHLDALEASMLFHGATDSIMYRVFPLTLKRAALLWFTHPTLNNIDQWTTLANGFNIWFTASREQPRSTYTLSGIRHEPHEPLRAYLDRSNTEAIKVCTLSLGMAVHILVTGMQDGLFMQELAKYSDLTKEDLRPKTQQFINLEETRPTRQSSEHREYNPHDDSPRPSKKPKYSTYTPFNASRTRILQEFIATHLVQFPKPNPGRKLGTQYRSKYYDFHTFLGMSHKSVPSCRTLLKI